MMRCEIKQSIKTVYGMLWDLIALYEKTDGYNIVPVGENDNDVWEYLGNKLQEIRREIDLLFLRDEKLKNKLVQIVDETEHFIRSYERPGVVTRWKRINPQILFFDCAFDLMEESLEIYKEISWGLTDLKLACYPDETLLTARKRYFANLKIRIERDNLQYSEDRVFQNEVMRTLTLVFEHDFRDYL